MKRMPTNAYTIEDGEDPLGRKPAVYGVVRCADNDMDSWKRLSAQVLDWAGFCPGEVEIEPPVWGWWRWNPPFDYYPLGHLTPMQGPGRGTWRGARVVQKKAAA